MKKKCVYLSEDSDRKLAELARQNQLSQSQMVDLLITRSYAETQNESDILAEKIASSLAASHLNLFKSVLQDTNRNSSYLLDILNSFISNFDETTTPEDFKSVEQNPHPWFTQSQRQLIGKIRNAQVEAYPVQHRRDEE